MMMTDTLRAAQLRGQDAMSEVIRLARTRGIPPSCAPHMTELVVLRTAVQIAIDEWEQGKGTEGAALDVCAEWERHARQLVAALVLPCAVN